MELLNKEQIGNSDTFPVTDLPVYLMNSEQIGMSEQFCDGQKVPYSVITKFDCIPGIVLHFNPKMLSFKTRKSQGLLLS